MFAFLHHTFSSIRRIWNLFWRSILSTIPGLLGRHRKHREYHSVTIISVIIRQRNYFNHSEAVPVKRAASPHRLLAKLQRQNFACHKGPLTRIDVIHRRTSPGTGSLSTLCALGIKIRLRRPGFQSNIKSCFAAGFLGLGAKLSQDSLSCPPIFGRARLGF